MQHLHDAGHELPHPRRQYRLAEPRPPLAVEPAGVVYVAGFDSDNVFMIHPDGTVTELIDASGDGLHPLEAASAIGVNVWSKRGRS